MLYTMLCCSYPFEKKEDDPQDVRTQTKVMQRIMKGEELCRLGICTSSPAADQFLIRLGCCMFGCCPAP